MKVSLVGMGPGNPELLTAAARRALEEAQLLVGAPRLLEPFRGSGKPCREMILAQEIADFLLSQPSEVKRAAVLLSGDIGFYSGAKGLLPLLREGGAQVTSFCGISTLQYFCALLGRPWEEVRPASAHGRACDPAGLLREHRQVFFLTGSRKEQTAGGICAALCAGGFSQAEVWVGSHLSWPDEAVAHGTAGELAGREFPVPSAVLALAPEEKPLWPWRTGGIPDDLFVRGEVPMTKQEVRAALLAKLRVAPGDVLWDVGAGTGSVSVELALLAPRGRVWAVERDPAAWSLVEENARRFGLGNLTLVKGEAPAALDELPAPDAVFVGGGSGSVEEILQTALRKNPRVRVVVAAVTLETLARGWAALEKLPFGELEAVQVSAARARKAGAFHLMTAQNPVFLLSGEGKGGSL
jgi:precorrin-6Y C5,15-methyltransferase (decarboxylating)